MERTSNHSIIVQILLWWAAWLLLHLSLVDGWDRLPRHLIRSIPILIGITFVLIVNIRILLPKLFFQKQVVLYVLCALLVLAAIGLFLYHEIFPWAESFSRQRGRAKALGLKWIPRMIPFVVTFLGSTLIEITRFANIKEKQAIESEKEKLETELKFLKSQVNPHFLFNALNNIYSLSVTQSPQTPESVMQLSEILRYMVYDSNEEKVPLKSEINYIENFVELKMLKDSRSMDVQISLDKSAPDLMIAPLLFIPFVENAFKHSKIENLKTGFIRINLETETGKVIFQVVNSIPENTYTKDKIGGVGLNNIKKQLELLYPNGQHELSINQTTQQFEIILKIMV